MEGSVQESASQPTRFTLGERVPGIGWAGRLVGLTSGPDALEKLLGSARSQTSIILPSNT